MHQVLTLSVQTERKAFTAEDAEKIFALSALKIGFGDFAIS